MKHEPEQSEASACDEQRLAGYVAEELDDADRAEVAAHLSVCGDCAESVRLAKLARDAVRDLPRRRCPSGVVAAAEEACLAELADRCAARRARGLTAVALAASVALVWTAVRPAPRPAPPVAQETAELADAERALTELRALSGRAEAVSRKVYRHGVEKPVLSAVEPLTNSQLGSWGGRLLSLLETPESEPIDAS